MCVATKFAKRDNTAGQTGKHNDQSQRSLIGRREFVGRKICDHKAQDKTDNSKRYNQNTKTRHNVIINGLTIAKLSQQYDTGSKRPKHQCQSSRNGISLRYLIADCIAQNSNEHPNQTQCYYQKEQRGNSLSADTRTLNMAERLKRSSKCQHENADGCRNLKSLVSVTSADGTHNRD